MEEGNYMNKLKPFIIILALSIVILSGTNLISATYGAYVHPQEDEMDIQACFIFPETIQAYKDRTYEVKKEARIAVNDLVG